MSSILTDRTCEFNSIHGTHKIRFSFELWDSSRDISSNYGLQAYRDGRLILHFPCCDFELKARKRYLNRFNDNDPNELMITGCFSINKTSHQYHSSSFGSVINYETKPLSLLYLCTCKWGHFCSTKDPNNWIFNEEDRLIENIFYMTKEIVA